MIYVSDPNISKKQKIIKTTEKPMIKSMENLAFWDHSDQQELSQTNGLKSFKVFIQHQLHDKHKKDLMSQS